MLPPTFLRLLLAGALCWTLLALPPGSRAAGVTGSGPAASPAPAADASTPRDTLRQAVEPLVDVFARSPDGSNHAVNLRLRLAESTNQPPELQGSVLAFRCQPPDKVYLQFAAVGTIVSIGRQGQNVWVSPASKLRPILDEATKQPPTKEEKQPLSNLRLKIPKTLFWLAFRFAGLRDGGEETQNGVTYRKVEMNPPDEKPDKDKWLRFWVRKNDTQLGSLEWHNPDYRGTLVIEDQKLSASLPDSAFQPDAAQRTDLMELQPTAFHQMMTLLGKKEEARAKAQVERQKAAAGTAKTAAN